MFICFEKGWKKNCRKHIRVVIIFSIVSSKFTSIFQRFRRREHGCMRINMASTFLRAKNTGDSVQRQRTIHSTLGGYSFRKTGFPPNKRRRSSDFVLGFSILLVSLADLRTTQGTRFLWLHRAGLHVGFLSVWHGVLL